MQKLRFLVLTIALSALLAGTYGIIHDQVTYSISHEYFTRFKYGQFGFEPAWFGGDRPTVGVIGFLATWWVGILIGTALGGVGLLFHDARTRRNAIISAVGLVYATVIMAGIAGFFYGKYYLPTVGVTWWLPDNLVHKNDFITVGSIHNFSYAGGMLGLVVGTVYLLRTRHALRQEQIVTT